MSISQEIMRDYYTPKCLQCEKPLNQYRIAAGIPECQVCDSTNFYQNNKQPMKQAQYRLKQTWWDQAGSKYEPQTVGYDKTNKIYILIDVTGEESGFTRTLVENTPELFEKVEAEEPKRWRAKKGEFFFVLSSSFHILKFEGGIDDIGAESYEIGNHFKTEKQCAKAKELLEKTLEQFHREEGNYE